MDGVWTVAFKGPENEGSLAGRITAGKFSGDWKSKMTARSSRAASRRATSTKVESGAGEPLRETSADAG